MGIVSASKREVREFFIINFGLVLISGVLMYFSKNKENFALLQMFFPAAAAIIALKRSPERRDSLPNKFFNTYLAIFGLVFIIVLIDMFFDSFEMLLSTAILLGSIGLWAAYRSEDNRKNINYGLKFRTYRSSLRYSLIFIATMYIRVIVSNLLMGEGIGGITSLFSKELLFTYPILVISFFVSMAPYFGEEYGWRFFLQPVLQEKFGRKKGVIILGFIWGIWHLPLNLMLYSPVTPLYSILTQIVFCIFMSIFMGWAYMRTDNIWAMVSIHFINNNLFVYLSQGNYETLWDLKSFIIGNIVVALVYVVYLFTKEYHDDYPLIMEYRTNLDELDEKIDETLDEDVSDEY